MKATFQQKGVYYHSVCRNCKTHIASKLTTRVLCADCYGKESSSAKVCHEAGRTGGRPVAVHEVAEDDYSENSGA